MMQLTETAPTSGHYINVPSQQVEEVRTAEYREMDENNPDLPDPEEPTTDGPWSDIVRSAKAPVDVPTKHIAETGV